LANSFIAAGAIAFIGFPDIPFCRFDGETPRHEPELTAALQDLYGRLTSTVLLRWFQGTHTIAEIVDFIRITVRALTQDFARNHGSHPYRNEVVAMFEIIATGVTYEGNAEWRFPGTH
jgi:hypothetical protein